jgi:hypothetical protein
VRWLNGLPPLKAKPRTGGVPHWSSRVSRKLFQRFGRHLNYRGRAQVNTEIKLLGAVHNLNKLFKHGTSAKT